MPDAPAVARYHVPNLLRALDIVELLSRHPAGLAKAELIGRLGLSSNSVYRIAGTLLARGYLDRDEATKRFRLTPRLLDLGCAARDEHSLAAAGWEAMRELRDATGESVFVGQRLDLQGVVLEHVPGLHPVTINVDRGTRFDLHASAPGKCLLAFLPEPEQKALLGRLALKAYTPNTRVTRAALVRDLDRARVDGYTIDHAEFMAGVHCVAVPLFARARAIAGTLWIVCPADRLPPGQFRARARILLRFAERISYHLGHRP